jgi:Fe/S biogenesis protein NfuA
MFKVSETAREKIIEALKNYKEPVLGVRAIAEARSPFQVQYALAFVSKDGVNDTDSIIDFDGFKIYIEKDITKFFEGVTLEFESGSHGSGFKFANVPRVPKEYQGTLAEKVVKVIDEQINPGIASHGGFVSLVDIKGTDVIIQMGGGCQGCGMANVTLKDGIEVALKEAIPEITAIYDVTDHADGKNPYYQES